MRNESQDARERHHCHLQGRPFETHTSQQMSSAMVPSTPMNELQVDTGDNMTNERHAQLEGEFHGGEVAVHELEPAVRAEAKKKRTTSGVASAPLSEAVKPTTRVNNV